jgi:arylsulfatase A-like enzyme
LAERVVTNALAPKSRLSRDALPTPTRPTPRRDDDPPILFISIDSLRNDQLEQLEGVIDALGSEIIVPEEPRTQGHATQESHGATFTSLHPGTHGLPHANTLPTDVPTLPEFLAEQGYRCSACVSTVNLDPEFGFGRGYHRYERQEMSWTDRAYDVRTQVDTVRSWMETDDIATTGNRFYFLHCFDVHYPYLPPFPLDDTLNLSHELCERVLDLAAEINTGTLQTNLTIDDIDLTEAELQQLFRYYKTAIRYVDNQITRLLMFLDDIGVLSEMLVVIAGDHGEEFLERGTLFHTSLYDENIRPAVIIKPPKESSMRIPDRVDLIDLYPTIAELVSESAPAHCQGVSWYADRPNQSRITEQLTDNQYQIAVEQDGLKGIFKWSVDNPSRPAVGDESSEPMVEFYRLQSREDGPTAVSKPSGGEALRKTAISFITNQHHSTTNSRRQLSSTVADRLDQLGYR